MTAAAPLQAVIFDFGGVLWDMRWDVCRALEAEHGLATGSLAASLYDCEDWRELELGRGERDAWLAAAHVALERMAARPLPPVHAAWRATQRPIDANVALLSALRPAYRLAILSNNDRTLRSRLQNGLRIVELFDDVVCSAEVGLAKPDARIYRLACERLALPPAACVFVDDSADNVRAAEAAGLHGVLYRVDRGDDLRAQLAALGVVAGAA